uniref:Ankyrin repeat domain-containing protein 49 n=1 Tax=Parascaris univalens TaxID=6257 RepID=A0A915ABV1_PARUN
MEYFPDCFFSVLMVGRIELQTLKTMEESDDEPMEGDHEVGPIRYEQNTDGSDESIDSLSALPDTEALERIRDEKKRGMFVSGWEEDDEGIAEKNPEDPAEQMLTAAETGDIALLEKLYQRDPSLLQARDCDNYTPLHRAAYSGHADAVRYLLSIGGDPELRTENGWTVIHCAAFWACYDIVAMLLSHGVDVNSKTNGNLTPLHLAINSTEDSEKVFHTVRYLLEAPGIDASAVSNAGDTPIMLARRTSPRVYEIIERYLHRR